MFASSPLDFLDVARVARSAVYRQSRRGLVRGDSRYPLYESNPEAVEVVERVFIDFDREVERNGATPVVIVFSGRRDSTDAAVRDIPEPYAPLLARLKANDIAVIDLADVIVPEVRRHGTETLFAENGHYAPQGNRLIASTLAQRLPGLVSKTCGG